MSAVTAGAATAGSAGGGLPIVVAALSIGLACLVLGAGDAAPRRLTRVVRQQSVRTPGVEARATGRAGGPTGSATRNRLLAAGLAGLGVALAVGGVVGLALGAAAGVACAHVLGRLEPRAVRERRERVARDLPVAAGLMAGAVAAGATPVAAVEVVGAALADPLGADLRRVAALSRLGGDVSAGLQAVGADAALAPLARTIARAVDTGAPLADALDRLATDLHADRRSAIDIRARAVGVRSAAPLGLCFLPAFLLIGVVPVVAGIATEVLGGVL